MTYWKSTLTLATLLLMLCTACSAPSNVIAPEPAVETIPVATEEIDTEKVGEIATVIPSPTAQPTSPPTAEPTPEPAPTDATPPIDEPINDDSIGGNTGGTSAYVDHIEVVFLDSHDIYYAEAVIYGNLADGCQQLEEITSTRSDDNRFTIDIAATAPEGMMCTMALVPFEESVPLDLKGLPAGVYQVTAGDLTVKFTLEVDNDFDN